AQLVGLAVSLGLAWLSGWLYFRHRERVPAGAPDVAKGASGNDSDSAAPIFLSCPDCEKKIKAKATLAGKKVRCPQCGVARVVPDTRVSSSPSPTGAVAGRGWAWAVLALVPLGLFALWAAKYLHNRQGKSPVETPSYFGLNLGVEFAPGIEASGFYGT